MAKSPASSLPEFRLPATDRSLGGGQESIQKGVEAVRLQNLIQGLTFNRRNTERLLQKHEREDGVKPAATDAEMRIDSDDIHNHYHYENPKPAGNGMGALSKLAGAALIASGIGIPAGIAAWNLPEIIKAFSPAEKPGDAPPAVTDIWSEYELVVGKPKGSDE